MIKTYIVKNQSRNLIEGNRLLAVPQNFLSNDPEKQRSLTGSSSQKLSRLRLKFLLTWTGIGIVCRNIGPISHHIKSTGSVELKIYYSIVYSTIRKDRLSVYTTNSTGYSYVLGKFLHLFIATNCRVGCKSLLLHFGCRYVSRMYSSTQKLITCISNVSVFD